MNIYAIIMAGGVGSRFWPMSREKKPKQLLNVLGTNSLLQRTVERLQGFIQNENILIVTNTLHAEAIAEQLPFIPSDNIIKEPFGRNTAPCIAVASMIISKRDPEAVTIVLPADHLISDKEEFERILKLAAKYAYESKNLGTIGIPPTRPETGYGYIQIDKSITDGVCTVHAFAEKPNYATAIRFLESGDYLWNSGMFIWRVDTILAEMQLYLPEMIHECNCLHPVIDTDEFYPLLSQVYGKIKGVSIDYGIMEKSNKVFLVKGHFGWSDVGSWEEVYQLSEKDSYGNSTEGNVYLDFCHDTYIQSPEKFTAVIGAENFIIINTKDALLVCRRDQAQEVKKVVEYLKLNKMSDYL